VRVIAFYPALNPGVNDIAGVLHYLIWRGHQVLVVTARRNTSKSSHDSALCEEVRGLTIVRPFSCFFPAMVLRPDVGLARIGSAITAFNPEVALCSHEWTVRAGLALQTAMGRPIPLVVVTEWGGRLAAHGYGGLLANLALPLTGLPRGRRFWPWLGRHAAAIITCDPGDRARLAALGAGGAQVVYVPWCNGLPAGMAPAPRRDPGLAVYVGAFSRRKGTDCLGELVPALLRQTPTRRVVLVGDGRTGVARRLVRRLGDRVSHQPGLSRRDALTLLSRAAYGISPTRRGGWGFIGDCWAVRTPVVALASDYDLTDRVDALVGGDVDGVVARVQALYDRPELAGRLVTAGHRRYCRSHSAEAVGRRYEAVLAGALAGPAAGP
jgi:glycosyltransferase involved in cell wall biosynthesis